MNWKTPIANVLSKSQSTAKWLALHDLTKQASYLEQIGWFDSVFCQMAVDGNCEPIPWLTYPSIAFIGPRLTKTMSLFEYGSGNSTLWWARHVARVVSCEHDKLWHDRMAPHLPSNVEYIYAELNDAYCNIISQYSNEFDIVVIDGRERVRCARSAMGALKPDGMIIWDNTDRGKYEPGIRTLLDAGFRRIDFHGMVPILPQMSVTSIFYRRENCFGM